MTGENDDQQVIIMAFVGNGEEIRAAMEAFQVAFAACKPIIIANVNEMEHAFDSVRLPKVDIELGDVWRPKIDIELLKSAKVEEYALAAQPPIPQEPKPKWKRGFNSARNRIIT